MVCGKCKFREAACQLERDRIIVLDATGCVTFVAPSTNGLEKWIGRKIEELVRPEDVTYVSDRARCVLEERLSARWLVRDAWDTRTWLTHAEPAESNGNGDRLAIATLRPVCHMLFALSARQREILHLLTRICCTKTVASEIGIGAATIRSHLSRAQATTRCSDLTELLRWANDMQHALSVETEIAAYLTRHRA